MPAVPYGEMHKIFKNLIERNELCLWNDNIQIYIHPATGSSSAIDLSLCSPSLFLDFEWSIHQDLCGSYHFPTVLHYNNKAALLIHQNGVLKKQTGTSINLDVVKELTEVPSRLPKKTAVNFLHKCYTL